MNMPLLPTLSRAIAHVSLSIRSKLSAVLLTIVGLLIAIGGLSLYELDQVNRRTDDLVKLQRKIAAFRQIQQDTMAHLYSVSTMLLATDETALDTTLRQLSQFGYDLDRLQFVADDEREMYARVRRDYDAFIGVVGDVVALLREQKPAAAREAQVGRVVPVAARLERLTNELANRAEADMLARVDEGSAAYARSRMLLLGLAGGSVLLALVLGYAMSWSLIEPVRLMDARCAEIAAGQFERRIEVPNRDELGALATGLNRMSAELGRLVREVQDANRNKSAFLANMSHELRTPLNAIIGFSEALIEQMFGELNDKQLEYAKDIHSSGHYLLTLINDVLDMSKAEAGRMELEPAPIDLPELLGQAVYLMQERALRHGLTLQRDWDEATLGDCVADARKLRQALLNLLSNAVKFTPAGGCVTLRARRANATTLELAVTDTGVGIAAEDQAHIFEPFRQASGNYLRKAEGTGLGLALARRFVELHGGLLTLESRLGEGSTFAITLPACPAGSTRAS
jgi:signal transduction histidine kinase